MTMSEGERRRLLRSAQMFTPQEAAGALGVHRNRLHELIREAQEEGVLSDSAGYGGPGKDSISLSFNDIEVLGDLLSGHCMLRNVVSSENLKKWQVSQRK